jgi:MFS transporter, FSR family, fosmidomycin resistance protein
MEPAAHTPPARALAPIVSTLYLVAAAHFINDIYMGFLTPLYPIVMDRFGLSLSMVGVISMVAAMASALSQPIFGMIFDRFGVSASVYLAPLLTGLLVSLMGVAPTYPLFLALLFLGCLGSAAFHPKGASVTPTLSGDHRELGMAIFSAGGNIGYAAGPALIAFFISLWGLKAMPVLAVPAAAVALVLFLLLPVRELERRTAHTRRVRWRELLADRTDRSVLLRLVLVNFSLTVSVRGLSTFLPVYMAQASIPVTSIGVLFTVMLAIGAVVSVFASALSHRTGKRALVLISLAGGIPLAIAGYLLFPSMAGKVLVVAAGTVLSFSNPLLILLAQKHSGDSPAMASSLIMGFSWGLAGLAMVPLGWLGEAIGIRWMMIVVAAFPALALLSGARLPRDKPRSSPTPPSRCASAPVPPRYSQRYSPATWNSVGRSRTPETPIALQAPR